MTATAMSSESTSATNAGDRAPFTPRLLPPVPTAGLVDHLRRLGAARHRGRALIAELEQSGLRGRGGAGFPTAVKMEAVRSHGARLLAGRTPIVVANGTEGEPLSAKDKTLLVHAPHLVLDGMVAAARAVGADEAVVCVERNTPTVAQILRRAIGERGQLDDGITLRVATTPARYVVGEETALVNWLNGGDAKPTFTPPRPFERGVGRRPTLVDNVETLAHVALIERFGAPWWRKVGTTDDPGSMLVTLTGVDRPGVYEVPLGTPLKSVLRNAGAHDVTGVLVGGYFGTWLTARQAAMVTLSSADLKAMGAGLGCGAIAALHSDACPLVELARVTRWLASQSAGQCGVCVHGLPAIAGGVEHIANGRDRDGSAELAVRRWTEMVAGRGACKLPDGALRFVTSGFTVFAEHIAEHAARGPCAAAGRQPVLPVPRPEDSFR
jgi:NADH:ubiquinone oxidoreductase subunit F (NADH-binding)